MDEMNFAILLDNMMAEEFKTLSPFYNIPELTTPYNVSGNLTLFSPANNILMHYLKNDEEDTASDTIVGRL